MLPNAAAKNNFWCVLHCVTVFIWLWDWPLGFKLKTIDKRSNEDEILQAECNPITVIPTINCCWWILLSDDTLSGSYAGDKYCCQSSKVFLCGNKYQSCMMLTIGWQWDDINLYNWNCSLLFLQCLTSAFEDARNYAWNKYFVVANIIFHCLMSTAASTDAKSGLVVISFKWIPILMVGWWPEIRAADIVWDLWQMPTSRLSHPSYWHWHRD